MYALVLNFILYRRFKRLKQWRLKLYYFGWRNKENNEIVDQFSNNETKIKHSEVIKYFYKFIQWGSQNHINISK